MSAQARYLALQAYDKGMNAAHGYIIARKKYPLQPGPSNPYLEDGELREQWAEGFTDAMKKHGNWK